MEPASEQTQHKAKYHRLTSPIWAFLIILLFTLLIFLFPPDFQQYYSPNPSPPNSQSRLSLLPYPVGLPRAFARCSNACLIDVCTHWIPGPSDECPNPGKGGGCCIEYAQKCDPNCREGDEAPSVSGNVACDQWGQNGWCIDNAQLVLTASDPQDYAVTISGNAGNVPISCNAGCTVDLPAGTGLATYVVTAATSNLTNSGSTAWAYDPDLPVPDVDISGTSGANGWYVSPVSVSATGADAISGIAGASIFVDGGSEQSSATVHEGLHQIIVSAIDNAGNTASSTPFIISVDTTTPVIDISAAGAAGANGWYVSEVQVSAAATDSTSGIDSLEVYADGVWQAYSMPLTLADGRHAVRFRATDNAGNVTTTAPQQFLVDTTAPVITATITGTSGMNGWYVSGLQVAASAGEAGSGLDTFEQSVDGGAWQTYSAPLSFITGRHTVQFRAADRAGNLGRIAQSVLIDSAGPVIDLPVQWTLGKAASYNVIDQESGLASVRVVIEDENERYAKMAWDEDVSGGSFDGEIDWDGKFRDGTTAPPGTYLVWVKAKDNAGNASVKLGKVTVEASLFSWLFPPKAAPTARPTPVWTPMPTAMTVVQQAYSPTVPNRAAIVVSRSSSGGMANEHAAEIPAPVDSSLPLVSAAMAAAAAYAARRKQEEESILSNYQRKMRAKRLAEIDAEGEARAEQKAYRDWLRTGKNPPRGMEDVSEAERLAIYQETDQYKSYVAGLQAWEKQQENERKAAQADMTQAERLAAYQQTDRYKSYQARLHAWEVQKAQEGAAKLSSQNPRFDGLVKDTKYEFVDGKRFVQGAGDNTDVHPGDIEQSYYLSDCYLLAPLAEIALQDPQVIRDMIKPIGYGEYSVTIYVRARSGRLAQVKVPVTIDLPEDRNGNLVFVHGADSPPQELWPMLIEKAWARYYGGSYNSIAHGGWPGPTMEALTGVPTRTYKPSDLSIYQLNYEMFLGHAVTASTNGGVHIDLGPIHKDIVRDPDSLFASQTLYMNHEYYVVRVDQDAGTITLRNPWGWQFNETTLPYDQFQRAFQRVSVNPLH